MVYAKHSKNMNKMPNKSIDQGFKFHYPVFGSDMYDFYPTSHNCGPDSIPLSKYLEVNDMSSASHLGFEMIQRNRCTPERNPSLNV